LAIYLYYQPFAAIVFEVRNVDRMTKGGDDTQTSLLHLLTTEPISNYCNAATDLNNVLEEIARRNNNENERAEYERMIPSKIRRLRTATREIRDHLSQLDSMATAAMGNNDDIREHAERTRRAVASIVHTSPGCRFHTNGIPRVQSAMGKDLNINLIAISTVKASIVRLKEKIKESS
jgi:plasmid stabilization system protein ParE